MCHCLRVSQPIPSFCEPLSVNINLYYKRRPPEYFRVTDINPILKRSVYGQRVHAAGPMELQALLVLCGVGVAGVAVLLLMSLFSSSGTSYEEAIAQQRKATTELLALAENKNKTNKKNNKKAIKKQAKKEKKESVATSTGSDHESEAPAESGVEDEVTSITPKAHVEFSPSVVVDVPRDSLPNVKIRKRGKDPKVKPILVNKEDPSCVSDPAATAAAPLTLNHFDEIHPKDEFELLQTSLAAEKPQEKVEEPLEKKEAKIPKAPKATKVSVAKPAPSVETVKEETRERRDSGDAPKEQRKAKKAERKPEKPVEEVVEVREEVIPPLNAPQPSELTTEKLLKQAQVAAPAPTPAPAPLAATPPGGKKKKKTEPNVLTLMAGDSSGVNVGELVRVVREAALSRTEIQILTDALLNKHHDPLPMHSEWTEGPNDPMQKLKKQLADKEKQLADEVEASQALHAKLKELRGSLNASRSQVAGVQRAAEATEATARAEVHTLQARLTRLLDDNHALAQEKIMLQQKLGAEGEAQAQRVQMEIHIQRLSETEAALMQQLAALQAECGAHALDAGAARDNCIMAQQHAAEMAQQLQEANRACNELEQQRQMAVHGEQRAQQDARAAQDRLNAMGDLQNEVQRLSSRAQAAEANADKVKEEAEKQKQQLSSEVALLGEQLAAREAELAEVKQLKAATAHNGLPPSTELHKAAELAAVESVVEALREELSAAQHASRDQSEQLRQLQAQLQTYQDKNNELRTKNWKVMEALQSAEKALQTNSKAAPAQDMREAITKAQEAQYTEVASVLRTAFPAAAPSSTAGRDWLHAFADNLKKELQKRETEKQELEKRVPEKIVVEKVVEKIVSVPAAAATPGADERLGELQAQNEHLQGLVDKYKRVIDDTEGVLSRLQQNVTTEETRWAQQLADKQRELDDLRTNSLHQEPLAFAYSCIERSLPVIVEELQSKIVTLESQLAHAHAQAQPTNHNHSFADAERLTEERLLAGLSEKHNLDVCNGPSQVGLEDK